MAPTLGAIRARKRQILAMVAAMFVAFILASIAAGFVTGVGGPQSVLTATVIGAFVPAVLAAFVGLVAGQRREELLQNVLAAAWLYVSVVGLVITLLAIGHTDTTDAATYAVMCVLLLLFAALSLDASRLVRGLVTNGGRDRFLAAHPST